MNQDSTNKKPEGRVANASVPFRRAYWFPGSKALPDIETGLHCTHMIRNIIFDWSGTLVDDLPAVWKATNYVLTQAERPEMTLEQFRAEFCLPFTIFYDRHVPHVPLPQLEDWFHSSLSARCRIRSASCRTRGSSLSSAGRASCARSC